MSTPQKLIGLECEVMNGQRKIRKDLFFKRIDTLIQEQCGGIPSRFNEAVGERSASSRWKKEDRVPKIDKLVRICNRFNVSLDWLMGAAESVEVKDASVDELKALIEHYIHLTGYYRELVSNYKALFGTSVDPCKGVVSQD